MSPVSGTLLPWPQFVAVLTLSLFLKPCTKKDRHRLGNPPLAGDPVPHRPRGDSQLRSGTHLGEAEMLQGGAQLFGSHGHGRVKIGTTEHCLASRHIVPTFGGWLLVLLEPLPYTSAPRSTYSASSMTSSDRACPRGSVTRLFSCSRPRDASSGLPW